MANRMAVRLGTAPRESRSGPAAFRVVCTTSGEPQRGAANPSTKPVLLYEDFWHSSYRISVQTSGAPFDRLRVSVFFPCERAWHLMADRKLAEVNAEANLPWPVARFVVVQDTAGCFQWEFPAWADMRLVKRRDELEVSGVLRDHARCGLSLWGGEKLQSVGRSYGFTLSRNRLPSLSECLWLEPYPRGARAAVCLTDHADYDSVEKVKLLANRFGRYGIRVTKSVFPQSDPIPGRAEPGLDVSSYRGVVETLRGQGSEIAFHGFGPRAAAPSMEECSRRAALMRQFDATTWIDHGAGDYLFSRSSTLPDGTNLTEFLEEFGIRNYWSYVDIWNNPFREASILAPRTQGDVIQDFVFALRSIGRLSAQKSAYALSHGLRTILGEAATVRLGQQPLAWQRWKEVLYSRAFLSCLRRTPLAVYGIDGSAVFSQQTGSPWIFDTLLLNHLGLQLRPEVLKGLIESSGLLLAHCYFGAQRPYMWGNCFLGSGTSVALDPQFEADLENLGDQQQMGELVTLSFAQLRESLEAFSDSQLIRTEDGWVIRRASRGRAIVAGNRESLTRLSCEGADTWSRGAVGYLRLPEMREARLRTVRIEG